jgi:hypothetical protein
VVAWIHPARQYVSKAQAIENPILEGCGRLTFDLARDQTCDVADASQLTPECSAMPTHHKM